MDPTPTSTPSSTPLKTTLEILTTLPSSSSHPTSPSQHHLCLHIYLPPSRGVSPTKPTFSLPNFPSFAGWRAAWLHPTSLPQRHHPEIACAVLPVDVRWHCGTAHPALITEHGDLLLHVPADAECADGVARRVATAAAAARTLAPVSICRRLTAHEIASACRGVVVGGVAECNNGRAVSHVVAPAAGGGVARGVGGAVFRCALFAGEEPAEKEEDFVELSCDAIEMHAPELMREYEARCAPVWAEDAVEEVRGFLDALFVRARENDAEVRSAIRNARNAFRSGTTSNAVGRFGCAEAVAALEELTKAFDAGARRALPKNGVTKRLDS